MKKTRKVTTLFNEDLVNKNLISNKTKTKNNNILMYDKTKTTNVNILLNRVRQDKKRDFKKKIIFTSFLIVSVSGIVIFALI